MTPDHVTPDQIPTVDPRQTGEHLLLDVREAHEWTAGHAPGAVHLPLSQLQARVAEVPVGEPVDVVCHLGGRSAQATAFLRAHGVDARNVTGGMDAWERLGLPLEADGGAAPRIV